jgi:hypothetical protein
VNFIKELVVITVRMKWNMQIHIRGRRGREEFEAFGVKSGGEYNNLKVLKG